MYGCWSKTHVISGLIYNLPLDPPKAELVDLGLSEHWVNTNK